MCAGNGQSCRRRTAEGLVTLPCPTPENCAVAEDLGCKPYGRLNVQLEGQDDELGSFVFRTTGYNSIRTLAARLKYFQALAGPALPCLPLTLKLRAKSTTQSHRSAVYFVDLVVREGLTLEQALQKAREDSSARQAAGWNQAALDQAALNGLKNGAFEDSEEEGEAVVEEFYAAPPAQPNATLADKLEAKATVGSAP